ncbi:hypothetical protein GGI12_002791 [Dipsacomyces acuminosporus]|nr:hypothetical protein GGI12_002791 [Dipsacomyces acuminosporus]
MAITVDPNAPANTVRTTEAGNVQTAAQARADPGSPGQGNPRPRRQNRKRAVVCRYFQQGVECKAGDSCAFLHIAGAGEGTSAPASSRRRNGRGRSPNSNEPEDGEGESKHRGRGRQARTRGRGGNGGNTYRKTQIESLLKAPKWTVKRLSSDRGESAFAIEMSPSDPDFPFDVPRLYLALVVPSAYPAKRTSDPIVEIQIANKRIPTGIKRNIEVGFSKHVRATVNKALETESPEDIPTLEDYIHWLDRNLEQLMQQKPATTIKFTSFAHPKTSAASEIKAAETAANPLADNSSKDSLVSAAAAPSPTTTTLPASRPPVRRPVPKLLAETSVQSSGSATSGGRAEDPRRTLELQQLQRRFRSSYSILQDNAAVGTVIKLDIMPSDPDMPVDITQLSGELTVVRTYPSPTPAAEGQPSLPAASLKLDPANILGRKGKPSTWQPAEGRSAYLDHIAKCFDAHVAEVPGTSLLHHLNWLDRQLVDLLSTPPPAAAAAVPISSLSSALKAKAALSKTDAASAPTEAKSQKSTRLFGDVSEAKPWVRTITLEEAGIAALDSGRFADASGQSSGSHSSSDSESSLDSQAEITDDDSAPAGEFSKPLRRGTEIRFGKTELSNVSLVYCHSLNIAVRCARCKNNVDMKGIAPTMRTGKDHQLWKACDTCTTILGVRFRPDWMFQGSTTLGYLDCSGCAPLDLLPSKYTISCEPCAMGDNETGGDEDQSSANNAGQPVNTIASIGIGSASPLSCKKCYARMAIGLHEPLFVQLMSGISLGGGTSSAQISKEVERTRKAKVNKREELARLGVVPGQPLPDNGACKHYRKSNRWLRFPCCGKAYPCDNCHDEKEDHPHEYAQVMLCGHCAKEQRISKAGYSGACIGCGSQVVRKVDGNHAFWQGGTGVRERHRMSRKDTKKYQGLSKTVSNKKVGTPKH